MIGLQENRAAVEVFSLIIANIGAALTGSVFLAPIGVPLLGTSALLVGLANGCDSVEVLKANARLAGAACGVMSIVSGVAAGIFAISVVGLPIAAGLGPIALILGSASAVLKPIGDGRAPRVSDVAKFIGGIASLGGADTSGMIEASRKFDAILANPEVQKQLSKISLPSSLTAQRGDGVGVDKAKLAAAKRLNRMAGAVAQLVVLAGDRTMSNEAVKQRFLASVRAADLGAKDGLKAAKVFNAWVDGGALRPSSAAFTFMEQAYSGADWFHYFARNMERRGARLSAKTLAKVKSAEKLAACQARGGVFDASAPDGCRVGTTTGKPASGGFLPLAIATIGALAVFGG